MVERTLVRLGSLIEVADGMPFVTQSQLKSWRKCKRQHYNRYILNIGKKLPPLPLIRGTILHEMIDARASGKKDPMNILEKYAVKYRRLLREEKEMYGDLIEDCRAIFLAYCRHWQDDGLTYEFTEIPAFTDLTTNIRYGATIDKIAVDAKGRRWLMDHKSHKNFPGEGQRMSDIQLVLYVWAWNRWQPSHQVSGIIWDYIRTKRPTVPELLKDGTRLSKAKIDTDYPTYMRAIKEAKLDPKDYADILNKLKTQPSPFFERVRLPNPSAKLIESIVQDAHDDATMIAALGKVLKTRNLSRDCDWCEFQPLCMAEIRDLDVSFIRKTQYETKEPREYYARMEED
jgi:hypothetical protein